jgi:hypothetical protein
MVRLFLRCLHHKVMVFPLVVWTLMVIPSVRAITLIWTTSLLVWNVIRCFVIEFFFGANETCAYNVKYVVENKRYWKGHTMKPFLPNSRIWMKCTHASFAKAYHFVSLDVVHVSLLLLVTFLPQGTFALLCMLVYITILVPRERIKRLWIGWTKQ